MKKCIVCGCELRKAPLFICHNMPQGAQNFLTADELNTDHGETLRLRQCSGCGLVQFDCAPVAYYRDVIRAGGYSSTMKELRTAQYQHFIELCRLEGKKIIEIGCGQGEFLQTLADFPVRAFGIEHNAELVNAAQRQGLNVRQNFTENEDTVLTDGPFDAFLSFNFLEHQPFPNVMLRCIYNNLKNEGVGLVTVPDFEYILKHHSCYELIRDHIANYTRETLEFLMRKNGFEVLENTIINRDTLAVIIKKRSAVNVEELQTHFFRIKKQLYSYFDMFQGKIAVWGASHQGLTLISTTGITDRIAYIIDSAPFKQGKYTPASHLLVVEPDYEKSHPVESILILAPGYIKEILQQIEAQLGSNIKIAALDGDRLVRLNF